MGFRDPARLWTLIGPRQQTTQAVTRQGQCGTRLPAVVTQQPSFISEDMFYVGYNLHRLYIKILEVSPCAHMYLVVARVYENDAIS